MANNERVSQLIELFAADLHSEDLFLITDMSQRESKKLELGQLLLFFENSGSFIAFDSAHADTASYVAAGNVDGIVAAANVASQSISSSWAFRAVSSSYASDASTASYASWCNTSTVNADTASFLKYLGTPNGTASYAIKAALADNATSAFSLFYNGSPNGTASWAVRAINSNNADSASGATNFIVSGQTDGVDNVITLRGAANDWANLFVSGAIDNGTLYIRTLDNGTEPIVFQTHDSNGGAVPVTRVSINYSSSNSGSTRFTVDGNISASVFSSSFTSSVGFYGTASHAVSASALVAGVGGPKFITPVTVGTSTSAVAYTTFSASAYIPPSARVVILDGWANSSTTPVVGFIQIRQDPTGSAYVLTAYLSNGGGDVVSSGAQGCFPISALQSFQYTFTQAANLGATLRLIGYY